MTCHAARRVGELERRLRPATPGVCEACGRPLSLTRPPALPEARLCTTCEEIAPAPERGREAGDPGGTRCVTGADPPERKLLPAV